MSTATLDAGYVTDSKGQPVQACLLEQPDMMFPGDELPNDHPAVQAAKAVCAACFFKDGCAQDAEARNEHHGVWGGKSEKDRKADKRRRYRRNGAERRRRAGVGR